MSDSDLNHQQEEIPIVHDLLSEDDQMKQLENDLESKVLLKTTDNEESDSDYEDIEDDETTKDKNKNDDDICVNIKPRSLGKKDQESEHSEDSNDENDNQNVPNVQSNKTKELLDDDNNTQSPAYVPRKGKFYEHDDRTLDDPRRSKQETSRNKNRFYRDSDAKWQHDLYFQDQKLSKSRRSHSHYEHRSNYNREQFQLNDYVSRPYKTHRQNPNTNFDFNDYNRSISNHYSKDIPTISRQSKGDYDQHQIDERTFHRRRNFINSQFQQHDTTSRKFPSNRPNQANRDFDRYDFKTNVPSRLQLNHNQSTIERPKRYSNMRNDLTNLTHQQGSVTRLSNSKTNEQNDWPQAPPPPTSYLPQQLITPQMFYQQQTSRYVPLNYSQTLMSEQFQTSK